MSLSPQNYASSIGIAKVDDLCSCLVFLDGLLCIDAGMSGTDGWNLYEDHAEKVIHIAEEEFYGEWSSSICPIVGTNRKEISRALYLSVQRIREAHLKENA